MSQNEQRQDAERARRAFDEIVDLKWHSELSLYGWAQVSAYAFDHVFCVLRVPVDTENGKASRWWAYVKHVKNPVILNYPTDPDFDEFREDPVACLREVLMPKAVRFLSRRRDALDEVIGEMSDAASSGICQVCGKTVDHLSGYPKCADGHVRTQDMDRSVARWGFA